jgi:hypothetical protein
MLGGDPGIGRWWMSRSRLALPAASPSRARKTRLMAGAARPKRSYGSGAIVEQHGSWHGKWRVGDRQVKRKLGRVRKPGESTGLTRRQAEAALRRVISEVRVPAPEERLSVAQAGRHFLNHLTFVGRKPSTLGEYESMFRMHIEPFFGDWAIDKVTAIHVERFIAQKSREGKAPKTIRNQLGLLHSIFAFSERRGWSQGNPCKHVDGPRALERDADVRFLDESSGVRSHRSR